MKRRSLKTVISALAVAAVLFCTLALSGVAFAQTEVNSETSLKAALVDNAEIVLTNDIKLGSNIVIEKAVTLDLNGFKLYRELGDNTSDDGNVIKVNQGGKLVLKDSSVGNGGAVSGGKATYGGGIECYGTLDIQGGNIVGNEAKLCGGAIYAAPNSMVTISNAFINENKANNGGGIYISTGANKVTLNNTTVKGNTALYDGGGIENLSGLVLNDSSVISNNAYDTGSGIYVNYGTMAVQGKSVVKKNNGSNIYLRNGRTIEVSGALTKGAEIGVSGDNSNSVITSGYSAKNSEEPANFFFADIDDGSVQWSDDKKEVKILTGVSVVEAYNNDEIVKTETFYSTKDAWDKALSYAGSYSNVVCRLGTNWSHDELLTVSGSKTLTLDLNGFYIVRTRNGDDTDDGNLFTVDDGATFSIIDSRPKSKGYDGIKGGVIAGGCNSDDGGGIYVGENATFIMDGGTIYNCYADGDGGGIYICDEAKKVELNNIRMTRCVADSIKADGGAIDIWISDFTMTDSRIDGCYSNDNGGAIRVNSDSDSKGHLLFKNVLFANNSAEDYAGAIMVDSFSDDDNSYLMCDNCEFVSNSSNTSNGGAVYFNDDSKVTSAFLNCTFSRNSTPENGGAIAVDDDNLILSNCIIEENIAGKKGGGVYVDSLSDINVKGKLIIQNNLIDDEANCRYSNLCLQEGVASTARLYSGGLYEGSCIRISTTDSSTDFARNIAEYQMKYFIPETGRIESSVVKTVETPVITASIFGRGSIIVIISVVLAGLATALAAIAVKKKKGDAENGNDEDE